MSTTEKSPSRVSSAKVENKPANDEKNPTSESTVNESVSVPGDEASAVGETQDKTASRPGSSAKNNSRPSSAAVQKTNSLPTTTGSRPSSAKPGVDLSSNKPAGSRPSSAAVGSEQKSSETGEHGYSIVSQTVPAESDQQGQSGQQQQSRPPSAVGKQDATGSRPPSANAKTSTGSRPPSAAGQTATKTGSRPPSASQTAEPSNPTEPIIGPPPSNQKKDVASALDSVGSMVSNIPLNAGSENQPTTNT